MEAIHKRVAGIDVHRMQHTVTILIEQADGTVVLSRFGSATPGRSTPACNRAGRRSISCWISATLSGICGGHPSTTQPIAAPWLSPKVVTRNRWPKVLWDIRFRLSGLGSPRRGFRSISDTKRAGRAAGVRWLRRTRRGAPGGRLRRRVSLADTAG